MATVSEIRQAQSILFKIRSGISVRTDPRSTVGKLVNDALQRGLDLEQSLKEQLEKGLLWSFLNHDSKEKKEKGYL